MNAKDYLITDEKIKDYSREIYPYPSKASNPEHFSDFQKSVIIGAEWAREKYEIKLAEKEKEIEQLKAALTLCEPYIHDMQKDNFNEPSVGINYDYNLEKAFIATSNLISTPETK